MGRSTAAPLVLTLLLAVVGVDCGILGGGGQPFSQDEADSVLSYLLVDYSIGGDSQAKGPKALFKVANAGSQEHELEILDDQGKRVGRLGPLSVGGLVKPLALELKAGTYTLQCNLKNKDGKVHRDLGMMAKLVVR